MALQALVDRGMQVGLIMHELTAARDCLAALQWAARVHALLAAAAVEEPQQSQPQPQRQAANFEPAAAAQQGTAISADAGASTAEARPMLPNGELPAPPAEPSTQAAQMDRLPNAASSAKSAEAATAGPGQDIQAGSTLKSPSSAAVDPQGDSRMESAAQLPELQTCTTSTTLDADGDALMSTAPGAAMPEQPSSSAGPSLLEAPEHSAATMDAAAQAQEEQAAEQQQGQEAAGLPAPEPPDMSGGRQGSSALDTMPALPVDATPKCPAGEALPGAAVFTKVSPMKGDQTGKAGALFVKAHECPNVCFVCLIGSYGPFHMLDVILDNHILVSCIHLLSLYVVEACLMKAALRCFMQSGRSPLKS